MSTGQMSLNKRSVLQASAAQTDASGTSIDVVRVCRGIKQLVCELDVTAAATESGDILDAWIQTRIDGTNWIDVVRFTRVLGNGSAKRYVDKLIPDAAESTFEAAATLSAATVRDILGEAVRVRWAITDAGTDNASFTFSVSVVPQG